MSAVSNYTSIGSNRSSSCAACSSTGILALGAGPFVALWDTEDPSHAGVYSTLKGHMGHVTTVKLAKEENGLATFISGDSEGNVRLWEQGQGGQFSSILGFEAHPKSSISALGVAPSSSGSLQIFTGASDGLVRVWNVQGGKAKEVQQIENKKKLPLDIELAELPGSKALVLVVAWTDRRIQLYTVREGKYTLAITLEGHEDWVRCLSFTTYPSLDGSSRDLLLASGSQDNYTRLWRIASVSPDQPQGTTPSAKTEEASGLDLLDEFERKLAGEAGANVQISTKAHVLAVEDGDKALRYDVTLEALLIGHEAGLTNIHWNPYSSTPSLLSTASDNSLVIWTPSSQGIWIPLHRFGALGGRGLSFFGAIWGKGGKSVMAGGWNGGWERWVEVDSEGDGRWEPRPGLAGHHADVRSLSWDPNGDYVISVSSDQTTRIHACCHTESEAGPSTWAEIARPQIHGYDMADVAWISPLRFASAADEKVARVFDAPGGFVESLASLGVILDQSTVADSSSRPKGATVPSLGLSNRALGKEAAELDLPANRIPNQAHDSVSKTLTTLPTEEELATSTLWPEVEKVYGHGYELFSIAASHDGTMVASACKASNSEHAVIRVHSTSTWDAIGEPLPGHTLTITRIAFSKDDEYILSCSRDRGWRLFRRAESGYVAVAGDERAHARMVLDCAWGRGLFATASRDKSVKIWKQIEDQWTAIDTIKLAEAATAVDIVDHGAKTILAVGTESGAIGIHTVFNGRASHAFDVDTKLVHVGSVNRLAWRPIRKRANGGEVELELASCGDDRSVRVFGITL